MFVNVSVCVNMQSRRYTAQTLSTTYVYDFPNLFYQVRIRAETIIPITRISLGKSEIDNR